LNTNLGTKRWGSGDFADVSRRQNMHDLFERISP